MTSPIATEKAPLIVDMDGTLVRSDILVESAFAYLSKNFLQITELLSVLSKGKAALKEHIASKVDLDVSLLPYDEKILDFIREARSQGRKVYLASASNERYVAEVADYLKIFDGWFASNESNNLSSKAKAARLVAEFGSGGFDYIGNERADLPVWNAARGRIAVRTNAFVRQELVKIDPDAIFLESSAGSMRAWFKLLRVHQWTKNALVLVPLLTAQRFDLSSLCSGIVAFFAFSLAASGIYIINDLVDVEADRKHPTKKSRPLALGTIPVTDALVASLSMILAAAIGAVLTSTWLAVVLDQRF